MLARATRSLIARGKDLPRHAEGVNFGSTRRSNLHPQLRFRADFSKTIL